MPRSRGYSSVPRGHSTRRRSGWEEGPFSAVTALSTAGMTLWGTGQTAGEDGLTIVRMRGEVLLFLSTVTTILDGFQSFAMGIGIVSDRAFAAGGASVPAPLTTVEWEGWLWHHMGAGLAGLSTTEVAQGPSDAIRIPIDSKAMRKVGSDETVFGAIELGTEVGTAVAQFSARTRMLIKLP